MTRRRLGPVLTLAAVVAVAAAAAVPGSQVSPAAQSNGPDTTGAAIWAHLQEQDYSNKWALWPGKGRLYEGREPHGMLLTTYLNDVAASALERGVERMPAGAIIVKENYMPNKTLAAVTVMYKVPGYNAEHNDWFFTKHSPSGELDKMPNGMAMEGRLPGCQNCHIAQKNNDYIFTGDLKGR